MLLHISDLAWGGSAQAFGMVDRTSKACPAGSGMFWSMLYLITCLCPFAEGGKRGCAKLYRDPYT